MIIQFYLYSLFILILFVFAGIGLTILLSPKRYLKYSLFFSPFIGLIYFSIVCWYFVNYSKLGLGLYAHFLLIPPAIFAITSVYVKKKDIIDIFLPFKKSTILITVISILIFCAVSLPYVLSLADLNAITIGNSDIGNYATISKYLISGTLIYNPFGADNWVIGLIPNVFSSHISIAIPSIIFQVDTYKLFNIIEYLFFMFSIPLIYIFAIEIFKFENKIALISAFLFGINFNMILIIYQGYLSQIIGMGYLFCFLIIFLNICYSEKKINEMIQYLPLSIILFSGLIMTYPTFLPIYFIPLALYLLIEYIYFRKLKDLFHILGFLLSTVLISSIILTSLFPIRIKELISYSNAVVGFDAVPMLPSWIIGIQFDLNQDHITWMHLNINPLLDTIFTVLVMLIAILSLKYLLNTNRRLFNLVVVFGFFFTFFYSFLIIPEILTPGFMGGGYKAYKLITYFVPFIIMTVMAVFNLLFLTKKSFPQKNVKIMLNIILILIILFSIFSSILMINVGYQGANHIRPEIIQLSNIGPMENVSSINIESSDVLEQMWIYYFIFPQIDTYSSYHSSPLLGEWTIVQNNVEIDEMLSKNKIKNIDFVQINSKYCLLRNGVNITK